MSQADGQGKHQAREAALQMLYQCEVGRAGAHESIVSYWAGAEVGTLAEPLRDFANRMVRGTLDRRDEIDTMLTAHAQNWRIERMNVIDRLVLRLAVFEMLSETDTPSKVIINEAIELARSFSGDAAVGFVNGVLDAVRKELRRT